VLKILDSDEEMDVDSQMGGSSEFGLNVDEGTVSEPLQTDWQDLNVESCIVYEKMRITWQLEVDYIEYLTKILSAWPIPRVATAYVLDLCDPTFHIIEKGKVLTADALIKNKVCRSAMISYLAIVLTIFPGSGFMDENHRFWRP